MFNHSGEGSAVNPGPVCLQLSQILLDIQKGAVEDTWGWRWEVTDPDAIVNGHDETDKLQEINGEKQVKEIQEINGKEPELTGQEQATEIPEINDTGSIENGEKPSVEVR